jgi:MOSC domain-containing protein YiiM
MINSGRRSRTFGPVLDAVTDARAAGVVASVSRSATHTFSKPEADAITLQIGLGVNGDAHAGRTVRHRSRVARDPGAPNLRQVHLIHQELFDDLAPRYRVRPGDLGENVTTSGVDLLGLPTGTRLHLGAEAVVEVTGLRNPCRQLDAFQDGLMRAVLDRDAEGNLIRKAGVMAVVVAAGPVRAGDPVGVELPPLPHTPLRPV